MCSYSCVLSSCCVLNNVSCFSPNRHRPFACPHVHIWARCLPVWAPSSPQIRIDLHTHTRTQSQTGTLSWAWAQANAKTPKDSSIDSSKSTSRLRCHRGHTHVVWHPHLFGIFDIDVDVVDCRCRCRCWMAATACALNVIDGSACEALRGLS